MIKITTYPLIADSKYHTNILQLFFSSFGCTRKTISTIFSVLRTLILNGEMNINTINTLLMDEKHMLRGANGKCSANQGSLTVNAHLLRDLTLEWKEEVV